VVVVVVVLLLLLVVVVVVLVYWVCCLAVRHTGVVLVQTLMCRGASSSSSWVHPTAEAGVVPSCLLSGCRCMRTSSRSSVMKTVNHTQPAQRQTEELHMQSADQQQQQQAAQHHHHHQRQQQQHRSAVAQAGLLQGPFFV
jgi:hypothetical protein